MAFPLQNQEVAAGPNIVTLWVDLHRRGRSTDVRQVTCLAWNPKDKEVLVTGSGDGTAKLWDFVESPGSSSHALQLAKKPSSISHKSIDSGKKAVTALVWHPDGTVFATGMSSFGNHN